MAAKPVPLNGWQNIPAVSSISLEPKELESYIPRLNQIIRRVKLDIPNKNQKSLEEFKCPITLEFPDQPIAILCGHIFDEAILKGLQQCPICRTPITHQSKVITPIKNAIALLQEKNPVITCSSDPISDVKMAEKYLKWAQELIQEKRYAEALKMYKNVLRYARGSEIYWVVPSIYDSLEQKDKAILSMLFFALYQIEEGKLDESIKTLNDCKKMFSIYLKEDLSYKELIALIEDLQEKKDLNKPIVSKVITSELWATASSLKLPKFPKELEAFLEGDCTIWRGKKRRDTHIVVPLFPETNIDGHICPLTFKLLDKLDKDAKGPGYNLQFFESELPASSVVSEKEFCWGVLTRKAIPKTQGLSYDKQVLLLPQGYQVPGVFNVTRALLWEKQRTGERHFFGIHTRSEEKVQSSYVTVTFRHSIQISFYGEDNMSYGMAGWRTFKNEA